ncbi:MAG: glycoside hydrolase family 2 TIM barrel-domain containing protein [Rikenellaceae bacterium]
MQSKLFLFFSALFLSHYAYSYEKINLSGDGWYATLDEEAKWEDDTLYLPADLPLLEELPINAPTDGWESLNNSHLAVRVPMTMDEYFSGGVNTWTYEGVSWCWRTFDAPGNLDGKILLLNVSKARMRAEVYINRRLAAYDVVGETPFQFDVSEYIKVGEQNEIAVRLTNPGGRRGWNDSGDCFWGDYCFVSNGRNFTTLGDVSIEIVPKIYISDIFVKNILPANSRNVEVTMEVQNRLDDVIHASIPISVTSDLTGKKIGNDKISTELKSGVNTITFEMELKHAALWSPDTPNLYNLSAKLNNDEKSVRFGVRTFEVKAGESGGHNYYLNGERFIFRSAIDWGYYAPTGDYATVELAEKSVDAALAMKQNGISFHRAIGDPLVMKFADEKGLCIYEEQGGFHPANGLKKLAAIDTAYFTVGAVKEKIRRMVIRDRNHPSLIIYSLSNEDNIFHTARKETLEMINSMDDSRLVINTSGPYFTDTNISHIRPYESDIRIDYFDVHTAYNRSPIYGDDDFYQDLHRTHEYSDRPYFLGEVNSVSGPINWYKTYRDIEQSGVEGYDTNIYKLNHDKIADAYEKWNLSQSENINSPDDVSMQAGRGMMYAHARHAQSIMCNNIADGYALNGWTPGPQSEGDHLDWSSAILDEGRNIKAPAESFTYWTRPLQIALARKNGKYFKVGDEVVMESNLINHGLLPQGEYTLRYMVDGTDFMSSATITVEGGECYAQSLDDISFTPQSDWGAGYITLKAELLQGDKVVADGSEQILLQNREAYKDQLSDLKIEVKQWAEAAEILSEAGAQFIEKGEKADVILVGDLTVVLGKMSHSQINTWEQLDALLEDIKSGATAIIRFDEYWADALYNAGVLSEKVTEWGGNQTPEWLGDGWGYLDHFVGCDSTANGSTIGTTAWEVTGDPFGFYPFESNYNTTAHGLYMSRPWLCKIPPIGYRMKEIQPTLAVTLAAIEYGEGRIILNPCYHVDEDTAFTDMLFFNLILDSK